MYTVISSPAGCTTEAVMRHGAGTILPPSQRAADLMTVSGNWTDVRLSQELSSSRDRLMLGFLATVAARPNMCWSKESRPKLRRREPREASSQGSLLKKTSMIVGRELSRSRRDGLAEISPTYRGHEMAPDCSPANTDVRVPTVQSFANGSNGQRFRTSSRSSRRSPWCLPTARDRSQGCGAGVRRIEFHGLRHTSATLALRNGEPALDVAARLDHSKTSMTLDIYGHATEGKAPDTLRRVLVGAGNG